MRSHRHSPSRPRKSDAYGADPLALVDDLLDRLADRVADRIVAGLGSQREQDAWLDLASAAERLGIHPTRRASERRRALSPSSRTDRAAACHFRPSDLDAWRHSGRAIAWRSISPAKPSGVRERLHSGFQVASIPIETGIYAGTLPRSLAIA